jgi:hypothetical protein
LTDEEWELVRACPVPLLLSKPTLWPEFPRICAAIDPEHDHEHFESRDEGVLKHGALLAQQLAGQFRVVSVGSVSESGFISPLSASVLVMSVASRAAPEGLLRNIPCDVLVVNATPAHR